MTDTYKNLGQAELAATTLTDIYTVPSSTQTIVSSIVFANRTSGAISIRLAHSVAGGAIANKDYLYYNIEIQANDAFAATLGICMATTDKLRAYASATGISVNVYGKEVS